MSGRAAVFILLAFTVCLLTAAPAAAASTYKVSVKTGDLADAGTDNEVLVTLLDVEGNVIVTSKVNLFIEGNALERGSTDTYQITIGGGRVAMVGVHIGESFLGLDEKWFLESIAVVNPDKSVSMFTINQWMGPPFSSLQTECDNTCPQLVPLPGTKVKWTFNGKDYDANPLESVGEPITGDGWTIAEETDELKPLGPTLTSEIVDIYGQSCPTGWYATGARFVERGYTTTQKKSLSIELQCNGSWTGSQGDQLDASMPMVPANADEVLDASAMDYQCLAGAALSSARLKIRNGQLYPVLYCVDRIGGISSFPVETSDTGPYWLPFGPINGLRLDLRPVECANGLIKGMQLYKYREKRGSQTVDQLSLAVRCGDLSG